MEDDNSKENTTYENTEIQIHLKLKKNNFQVKINQMISL